VKHLYPTLLRLLAACVLQFGFGASVHRGVWPVDWFLLAVAAEALAGDFVRTPIVGACAGLIEDALTQPLLGANAFAKALLGYVFTSISVHMVFEGVLAVGLVLAAASLVNDLIVAFLGMLLLKSPFVVGNFDGLLRAGMTGAAGAALYAGMNFPWSETWRRRRARRLR
jgi:rod shape-determining protein MreD